ncbi:MAG: four helix bundle protein [Bacteroidia bacterium]|nr:four helix bundle protein [Bacteroidia bacterium]
MAQVNFHKFKSLKVWQKGIDLAVSCYEITGKFPEEERFGLVSQMNRSAVSIPCNIAEGAGRGSAKDFSRFLDIARGSTNELETLSIIAEKVGLLHAEDFSRLEGGIDEIHRMLYSFQSQLKP